MPAFKVEIVEKKRLEKDPEPFTTCFYYDNGSLAYLDAMNVMVACSEFMASQHHALQLLDLVEHGGNMVPVLDYYNKFNKYHTITVQRLVFQKDEVVFGVTKGSIEEARQKVLGKTYNNQPCRIVIQKPTNREEALQQWHSTHSEESTLTKELRPFRPWD